MHTVRARAVAVLAAAAATLMLAACHESDTVVTQVKASGAVTLSQQTVLHLDKGATMPTAAGLRAEVSRKTSGYHRHGIARPCVSASVSGRVASVTVSQRFPSLAAYRAHSAAFDPASVSIDSDGSKQSISVDRDDSSDSTDPGEVPVITRHGHRWTWVQHVGSADRTQVSQMSALLSSQVSAHMIVRLPGRVVSTNGKRTRDGVSFNLLKLPVGDLTVVTQR